MKRQRRLELKMTIGFINSEIINDGEKNLVEGSG